MRPKGLKGICIDFVSGRSRFEDIGGRRARGDEGWRNRDIRQGENDRIVIRVESVFFDRKASDKREITKATDKKINDTVTVPFEAGEVP